MLVYFQEQYLNFPNQVPVYQEEASSKDKQEEKAQDKVDVKVTNHKKDKKSCTKTSTGKLSVTCHHFLLICLISLQYVRYLLQLDYAHKSYMFEIRMITV